MSNKKKLVKIDAGYMNALVPANVRGRMSNYGAEMMAGSVLLTEPILEASYIHNGIFRIICDVPADEMTRAGFELEGMTEDEEQAIQSRCEELDAMKHFAEALKWRNAFGGALVVLGLKDGGGFEDELKETNIDDIEFMKVYDRFECRPSTYYDTTDKNFGKIELWSISPKDGSGSFDIHSSRVLVFDGQSVPNGIRKSNDGWGASVIQSCFKQVIRMDTANKLAVEALAKMQQAVHKIPSLSEQVDTPEGEATVIRRVQVVDQVRGLYNTVVIDGMEEYEVKSMSLSGIKEVLNAASEAVSSVCRIPMHILVGRTEGGLNSGGDASKKGWYTQVGAWQGEQLKKPLDRLITLIKIVESKGSDDGGDYTLKFKPLESLTEVEQADVDSKKAAADNARADTFAVYMTNGVMEPDEVRDEIREEFDLKGDAPEPEVTPPEPTILNPGQKIVDPVPGAHNPALPKPKVKAR